MNDSSISQERLDLMAEAALRQLESGRDLDSVVMKLETKGLSPGEAQELEGTLGGTLGDVRLCENTSKKNP